MQYTTAIYTNFSVSFQNWFERTDKKRQHNGHTHTKPIFVFSLMFIFGWFCLLLEYFTSLRWSWEKSFVYIVLWAPSFSFSVSLSRSRILRKVNIEQTAILRSLEIHLLYQLMQEQFWFVIWLAMLAWRFLQFTTSMYGVFVAILNFLKVWQIITLM